MQSSTCNIVEKNWKFPEKPTEKSPEYFPEKPAEKTPKKAEIFPKIQPRVTQHSLVSLQYKPCLSFLYNQNNKPAHATLYIRYRVSPQPWWGQHILIALSQNLRPFGANHAPLARLTPGCMAMLRRFNITVQFLICSDCHPFWGHIVGMRKPGLLGAEWFCDFRTCCHT